MDPFFGTRFDLDRVQYFPFIAFFIVRIIRHLPQNGEILERYLTSITSSLPFNSIPHHSSTNSHQGNTFYDIHTDMTTQRSNKTINTALPQQETLFSHTDLGYPPHAQGQPKSNNVIKKTKFLYSKFKNLIISRGSKRTQVLPDEKQDPVVPIHSKSLGDASDEDTGTPPAVNTLFSPSSRTSWSFRKFHRSTQMSAPSTAHSSTTEVARNHPSASMDGIHPYGYQAMPRTSTEIRSGRRFSMPAFAGQASGSNTSVPQSLGTFNSRSYRRQQASSIISTH
ncbi:hypothetical protein CPB84DRAFT_453407 [Gymnopilus junonius]|uniref:Uncharacterized protein n=1 Tax=Gymnopilus junonius TaxID=109634 RepID=A0A9P5P056_GYMJU|nr:hypothetical protein CPB84DRAFT_453407 [Gymnopilus junonius]